MKEAGFAGKIAIVTGSASGIGAATAVSLAQTGARIVVSYTKSEAEVRASRHFTGVMLVVDGSMHLSLPR